MASYLDKFKVTTAIDDSTKLDLSCQHITTSDFFQLSPIYIKEMVPGERISINVESFTRLAPLAVPTYGRMHMKNRAFFVPFRTIFKGWNDFITDTVHVYSGQAVNTQSIGASVPKVTAQALIDTLVGTKYSSNVSNPDTANRTNYDFCYCSGTAQSPTTSYRKFTSLGRQVYKILCSLGYQIINNNEVPTGETTGEAGKIEYSMMPLLAYAKIYLDWYFPGQYYDDTLRTNIERFLIYDGTASGKVFTNTGEIDQLLQAIAAVNYDSDYFVSAFDTPVGTIGNAMASVTMQDPTIAGTGQGNGDHPAVRSVRGTQYQTPYLTNLDPQGTQTDLTVISDWAIHALHRLTDYMKRHQLVGARALDRYLARFGKNLASEKLDRSNYIGCQEIPIQIGDIMSQSSYVNSANQGLGSYAGKGIGYNGDTFEYSTDEYGYIIIMNSLVPEVGYYQGVDKTVLHVKPFDFWTPEFDQLGNQALQTKELWVPDLVEDDLSLSSGLSDAVFGWSPRYAEYKVGRDRLTGDWRVNTLSKAGYVSDSWHLMRKVGPDSQLSDLTHSLSFVRGDLASDKSQYDRIFQYTNNDADHFVNIHNFNVVSWSPMHALYDTFEFEEKGKTIISDVNGVKVN